MEEDSISDEISNISDLKSTKMKNKRKYKKKQAEFKFKTIFKITKVGKELRK